MGPPSISQSHALDLSRNLGAGKGGNKTKIFPVLATHVEWFATVCIAITASLPKDISYGRFAAVYFSDYSDDYIECEKYAQKVLGDRRHSAEQRVGAEFIRRGIR
jgi:hypothetical protein